MFKPEQDLLPPGVFGLDLSQPDISTQLRSPFTLNTAMSLEVKRNTDSA